MGRKKEHDDSTRAALLGAAEALIEAEGPNAATVRAVADAVGISTRAVYSVFGSKEGMLEALATRLFEMLSEAIDACPSTDDPTTDIVTASLDGFRRTALEHPSLYGLVFLRVVPELRLGPGFDEVASGAFGRLQSHLERLERDGRLGSTSAIDAAQSVHALTEGLASMELRGMLGGDGAERVWRGAITALVRGFAFDEPAPREHRPRLVADAPPGDQPLK
jgi:AcrR family transcriptional regulator